MNVEDKELVDKVFDALKDPLTNIEIRRRLGISRAEVSKAIKLLSSNDKIISRGNTSARRHMRLSTAIEQLFTEINAVRRKFKHKD